MKELSIPLLAALLAAALTAGTVEILRSERTVRGTGDAAEPRAAIVPRGSSEPDRAAGELVEPGDVHTAGRLDDLEGRLARIEDQLLLLSRRALETSVEGEFEASPLADDGARNFVLDVLQADRTRREEEREEERRQRLEERTLARARELAEELGLGPKDESAVASVLLQEMDRRQAMFDTMRDGSFDPASRELMRTEMEEIRIWKKDELTAELGLGLAERVLRSESGDRWGRFGGGDRRGDGETGGGFGGRRGRDGRGDSSGSSRE